MVSNSGQKGYAAEEALRGYFRNTGYFVVRGIPLTYRKYDVTDVDLWLYAKVTSIAAERSCVDVKRRKTPQAMERVLWTKGLMGVLGVDRAIVVTSDNRSETRDFAAAHGVGILQGEFLQRIIASFPPSDRLTEEELLTILKSPCVVDSATEWRAWFRGIKTTLLDSLSFDGCNSLLLAVKFLLDEYVATGKTSEVSVRLLYIVVSYLLICLDYASRSLASLDVMGRTATLTDGFRYGEAGRKRTEEIVQMALQLLADAGKTGLFSGNTLRDEFDRQVSEYCAEILGEYFAKKELLKSLFVTARAFENMAYARTLVRPDGTSSEQKALIGLFCDFLRHDRKEII
ncbi:MAG: hypothetical protein C0392_00010 [Syntrophus sp. (in: bacteria)]|nr:hypothetical protein [Syntrophus sp. (in: bacteria)]